MPHHRECWEENENHCASCSYHRGGTVLDPPDSETEVIRYIEEENRRIEEERRRQEEEARRRQEEQRLQEEQRQLEEQLRLLEEETNMLAEEVSQTNTLEEQSQSALTELSERERVLENDLGIYRPRENNNAEPRIILDSSVLENSVPYPFYMPEARNEVPKTLNKKMLIAVLSVILIIIVCLGMFLIIRSRLDPIDIKTKELSFNYGDSIDLIYGKDYSIQKDGKDLDYSEVSGNIKIENQSEDILWLDDENKSAIKIYGYEDGADKVGKVKIKYERGYKTINVKVNKDDNCSFNLEDENGQIPKQLEKGTTYKIVSESNMTITNIATTKVGVSTDKEGGICITDGEKGSAGDLDVILYANIGGNEKILRRKFQFNINN